jgi:hypothetical protein
MLKVAIASSKLAVMLVTPTNVGRPLGDGDGDGDCRGLCVGNGVSEVVDSGEGEGVGVGVDCVGDADGIVEINGVWDACGLGLMLAAQPAKTTGGTRLSPVTGVKLGCSA